MQRSLSVLISMLNFFFITSELTAGGHMLRAGNNTYLAESAPL